jgi:rubrerythrin
MQSAEREVERYLTLSRRIEIESFPWDAVREVPLTQDEVFALTYMMDIEAHTPFYMRDLATPRAMHDADVVSFLTMWAYEEMYHGEALRKLLEAAGVPVEADRTVRVKTAATLQETIERVGSWLLGALTKHFMAAHMAWGAINERTAWAAYTQLARSSKNPVVRKLLPQIAKDERRHYSFYAGQARKRLENEPFGQRFVGAIIHRAWTPVGKGVRTDDDVARLGQVVFAGEQGLEEAREIDSDIRKIPGLHAFAGMERVIQSAHHRASLSASPQATVAPRALASVASASGSG